MPESLNLTHFLEESGKVDNRIQTEGRPREPLRCVGLLALRLRLRPSHRLAHPTRRDVRIAGASRARPHPASANHLCLDRPQSWAEALTNLIAGLTPVAADDGGPIKDRLVPACKLGSSK